MFKESQPFLPMLLCSRRHRCGHQWSGGDAGGDVQRLRLRSVPLPTAPPAGPRALVLHPNVQIPPVLLLQELRLHPGALLVLLLQRIFLTGKRRISVSQNLCFKLILVFKRSCLCCVDGL